MIFKEDLKLKVENTTLQASHEALTKGQPRTQLTADVSAAATTIVVANWKQIVDDMYLLVGNFGEPTAEIVKAGATPTTTSVTVGALAFDHYADTPITVIPFNQIQFFRYATLVDANTVDITAGQLGADTNIAAQDLFTSYHDETNSTGYAYFRFLDEEGTKYSEFTVGVSYEGNAYNSIEQIAEEGCSMAGVDINSEFAKEDQLLRDANEAQDYILKSNDWIFELIKDDTSIASTENENTYALSGLSYALKYPNSKQGILNVKFGSDKLKYIDTDDMDEEFEGVAQTTLASDMAITDTTITLTDSYEFSEEGSVYVGANDPIPYTVNTETTGVLSGVDADDIDTAASSGANVWQGIKPGVPEKYTIFNGNIILDKPVETDEVGKKIKFKYLKRLSRFDTFDDTTDIPFYQAISKYIAYKIEKRAEKDTAMTTFAEFKNVLDINKDIYKINTMEESTYYNFSFSDGGTNEDEYGNN